MSEYWVSKKKYWCQYCEIYIADDAPSRAQHENGLRHKGNKDRFIRGLYKAGVKRKQESEEEKREMKLIDQAAQAAYARDVGAGLASSGAPSSSTAAAPAPKPKPPPPKPADPYTDYTTAASLGITDPEVDRLMAEAKVRQSEGRAGDWVAVVPPPPPTEDGVTAGGVKIEPEPAVGEVRKAVAGPDDEDDTRRFKMRKKTVAVGLGEIYDPGVIRVKPRVELHVKEEQTPISVSTSNLVPGPVLGGDAREGVAGSQAVDPVPKATEKPAWTRREWKWAGDNQGEDLNSTPAQLEYAAVDEKPSAEIAKEEVIKEEVVKEEPAELAVLSDSPGGSLFRKRKVPVGGTKARRKM